MASMPVFRSIIFSLITLFSLVVLGICAYFEYELAGTVGVTTVFVPLGLGAASLSVALLPLFLYLGNVHTRFCTSRILFEIIWFFFLWLLWAGTTAYTVVSTVIYYSPTDPLFISVEVFAFLNSFCAFIYYIVIFLYTIINAIRGRSIWTTSVKEAANAATPGVVVIPMAQPLYLASTQHGSYPPNVPLNQPYNLYCQQVPAQAPLAHPYNTYPQPIHPQGASSPQYNTYPPLQVGQNQNQRYSYFVAPDAPQLQASYPGDSLAGNNTTLPPQPIYNTHPVHGSQAPVPVPSGY